MKKIYLLLTAIMLLFAGEVMAAPGLKVTGKGVQPTNSKLYTNPQNRVTGLVQSLTLTNTGDVALNPGDEGYTLTLYSYGGDVDLQTYAPQVALAPGEEKTIEVQWDFDFTPLDAAYTEKGKYGSSGAAWDTFRVRENVTDTDSGYIGPWMDVFPYKVSFNLVPESSGTEISAPINFGFVDKATTLKYRIRATGAADVVVNSIEVPAGFTVSPATPFTVKGMLSSSSDNYQLIEITADPTIATGVLSGDIIITAEGCDPKSYKLQAVAMAEGDFFENFEMVGTLKGWVVGKYWENYELNYQMSSDKNKRAYQHSRSGDNDWTKLITPRLLFEEGGKMQFDAARVSKYTSDTGIKVYWSPDRSNWTLLKTLDCKGADGAELIPTDNKWGTYTLDNIPAGEGYIAFEGLYVFLNDVYGGKKVDVDHDILVDSFIAPAKGKVNDRINTTLTVTNMLDDKALAADAYTLKLMADGKVVDTAETVEIEAGKKGLTFTMGYTPHAAGDVELAAVMTIGNDVLTAKATVNVEAESSTSELVIGNPVSTNSNVPLYTNYKNSYSQNLYSAEMLEQYGLKAGARITGIRFDAYETTQKVIPAEVTMYLRKTDAGSMDKDAPVELGEADVVYSDMNYTFNFVNSGRDNYHDFLSATFATPFVYDGGALLLGVKSEQQPSYASATFKFDSSVSGMSIYKYNDTYSNYLTRTWSAASGIPVMTLLIEKEPAHATGTVTDSEGQPVADVVVSYTSGDVLYSATTDAEGNYSMDIFRPELEYTVTADNEYYPVATAEGTVTFSEGNMTSVKDFTLGTFAAERAYNVTFHITNDAAQSMEGVSFTLHSNNFSLNYDSVETILDADGNATIECFGGSHTITVSAPGLKTLSATFGINKDGVKEFNMAEDVKTPYGVKAELRHDVFSGKNDVALSWDNEVAVFSDDFEGYKPFAIKFEPWTGIDGDGAAPAQLSGSYDHAGELNYGQIINPYAVEPMWDLNNYWTLAARSGRQYLGFVQRNDGKPLNDMVITPVITLGDDFVLRFYAKGSDRTNARFTVGITEKIDNPAASDFVTISEGNYIDVSYEDWTKVQIPLGAYAGKDVKLAIRCISEQGSFVSMIDDVFVGRLNPGAAMAKPMRSTGNPNESFIITLDGVEVGTTTDYAYVIDDVAYGNHTLGVQAKYVNTVSEVVTVPLTISADDYVNTTVTLKTNNGVSSEGMNVDLTLVSAGDATSAYSTVADAAGVATFGYLPKGLYSISIEAKDFNRWSQVNDIQEAQNINAYLFETLVKPFNITVDPEEQSDGTFNALAKWNQNLGFEDSFESYSDFATGSFGGWRTLDRNEATAYSYPISLNGAIILFPGCSTTSQPRSVAPMVFNPAATSPAMTEDKAVAAPDGQKLVMFQGPQAATADKWLISPEIEVRDDYEWSILAKSYPVYPETLEFLVSETGSDNPADFKVIDTVVPSFEEWTSYTMQVSEYAGKKVRFAVHCITQDGFIALVDAFKVGRAGGESVSSVGNVNDYLVFLDGKAIGNTAEASYAMTGLEVGEHTFGVYARYASGNSEMAELPFSLTSGIGGVTVGSMVNVRSISGAILIDAPEAAQVTVTSMAGITMASAVSDGSQMRVDVAAGVYAVTVGKKTYKVIVR